MCLIVLLDDADEIAPVALAVSLLPVHYLLVDWLHAVRMLLRSSAVRRRCSKSTLTIVCCVQ